MRAPMRIEIEQRRPPKDGEVAETTTLSSWQQGGDGCSSDQRVGLHVPLVPLCRCILEYIHVLVARAGAIGIARIARYRDIASHRIGACVRVRTRTYVGLLRASVRWPARGVSYRYQRISGSVSAGEGARTCVKRDGPPPHQAVQAVVVNSVDCRAWRPRRWRQQCSTAGEQSFWRFQSKYTVDPLRRSAPCLTGSKYIYAASVFNGTGVRQ